MSHNFVGLFRREDLSDEVLAQAQAGPTIRQQILEAALAKFEANRAPGVRYEMATVERDGSYFIEFRPVGFEDFDLYLEWYVRAHPEKVHRGGFTSAEDGCSSCSSPTENYHVQGPQEDH